MALSTGLEEEGRSMDVVRQSDLAPSNRMRVERDAAHIYARQHAPGASKLSIGDLYDKDVKAKAAAGPLAKRAKAERAARSDGSSDSDDGDDDKASTTSGSSSSASVDDDDSAEDDDDEEVEEAGKVTASGGAGGSPSSSSDTDEDADRGEKKAPAARDVIGEKTRKPRLRVKAGQEEEVLGRLVELKRFCERAIRVYKERHAAKKDTSAPKVLKTMGMEVNKDNCGLYELAKGVRFDWEDLALKVQANQPFYCPRNVDATPVQLTSFMAKRKANLKVRWMYVCVNFFPHPCLYAFPPPT